MTRESPAVDEHRLQVLLGADDSAPTVVEQDEDAVEVEPRDFGLRVTYQSSAERLEAADFLVATRAQQETRLRTLHERTELARRRDRRP